MKYQLIILTLILVGLIGPVAAVGTTEDEIQIAVTDITIDPGVFMRGDTGTITVEITNTGTQGVAISRAELYSNDLSVINDQTYDAVGVLGPGISTSFTFTVKADVKDGIYYPKFYLDFRDSGCYRYYVPVQVESSSVIVSVLDAPDAFTEGRSDTITLLVGNIRDNAVNGVTVTPRGESITSKQTVGFVGTLGPDQAEEVSFDITPSEETNLTFSVFYHNGMNEHQSVLTIPVVFGEGKIRADPVVNNLEVQSGATGYTVTGDVTNAGLDNAYSIIVTVDSPAKGVDPLPVDVIGALEPDDFSSFEVTFTAQGATTIPLVVEYKDEEGNSYEKTFDVTLNSFPVVEGTNSGDTSGAAAQMQGMPGGGRGAMGMGGFGSGLGQLPIMEIVVVIIAGIVAVIAWRKGYFAKIRARIHERSGK
jgi:hypothetical protein